MSETLVHASLVDLVKSWDRNPKVAAARAPAPDKVRRVKSYNLRCRFGQGSTFDVAITVAPDGMTAHLKKTTIGDVGRVKQETPVETLKEYADSGQTNWIVIRLSDGRDMSIKRQSLKNALWILLAPH